MSTADPAPGAASTPEPRRAPRLALFGLAVAAAGVAIFAQVYTMQGLILPISRAMRVSEATAALTLSATLIGIALGAIPWALLGERIGKIRTLWIAMVAAGVLCCISALAPDFTWLLVLRLLTGLAVGGLPGLVVSLITSQAHQQVAVRMVSLYIGGTTLGGLSGRIIGSLLGELWGWRIGIVIGGVVSLGCAVVFLIWASKTGAEQRSATRERLGFRGSLRRILRPGLLVVYAQALLLMGAFITVFNYLGFHVTAAPFSVPAELVFLFFFSHLIAWPATPVTEALIRRFGDNWGLLVMGGGMIVGLAVLSIQELVAQVVGLLIFCLSFFCAHATASRLTAQRGGVSAPLASAVYVICYYAGAAGIGWLLGLVYEAVGWHVLLLVDGGVILLAMAAVAAWALTLRSGRYAHRQPTTKE